MDHSEHPHAHKKEPILAPEADAFGAAPNAAPAPPVIDGGDMPSWLSNPAAGPTAGQRWGRRVIFLGVALVAIVVAAGGTMLALDLADSNSSMEVVAANAPAPGRPAQAAADALPFVEKRTSSLPPLVLLPQDPNAAAKKEAVAAAAPAVPVQQEVVKAAPPVPTPAVVPKSEKADSPQPVIARKLEKPVLPVVAKPEAKPVTVAAKPAKKIAPKPSIDAVAKKAAIQAKRLATPTVAKAAPRARPIKGTMLQPPRERGLDPAFQDPPRQAIDRRCRPGELARECEERTR